MKRKLNKNRSLCLVSTILILAANLSACQSAPVEVFEQASVLEAQIPDGLSADEAASLASLDQIDDFPLYTMVYEGAFVPEEESLSALKYGEEPAWACSLFAAYGDPDEILYGRNFDWDFSPALLLFIDPPGGYASVSMVDIYYLGFKEDRAFGILDLPLEEQVGLLDAPYIPFDGMNEAGLAVGMAAVPPGNMEVDPAKETIDSLMVIRKILDGAATIDEAVQIIQSYNIDMVGTPVHYLISEKSGRSALIEFSKGEIIVMPNEYPWQIATNFLMSEIRTSPEIHCGRYGIMEEKLVDLEGELGPRQAMSLLKDVAQPSTQWSVVYRVSAGEVWVTMGGKFNQVHKIITGFDLGYIHDIFINIQEKGYVDFEPSKGTFQYLTPRLHLRPDTGRRCRS